MAKVPEIIHVTEDHSWRNTGITRFVNDLTQQMLAAGLNQAILCTGDTTIDPPPGVSIQKTNFRRLGKTWRWGTELNAALKTALNQAQDPIVHLHGVWMAPQWQAAREALKQRVPFVITAHGMLEPWLWHEQGLFRRLKKSAYWHLLAEPAFRSVSVLHAVTPMEGIHLASLFPKSRITIIPHAIDLDPIDAELEQVLSENIEPTLLFIGRLHPKKGIDTLIRAFALAGLDTKWQLVIVGPEDLPGYKTRLEQLASELHIESSVRFSEGVFSNAKWRLYRRAWVTVVPSHSEVIGMVNLESAACGTPTITTYSTGLEAWNDGGGLLVNPVVDELSQALRAATAWSLDERRSRGIAARQFVSSNHSRPVIDAQWRELYANILQPPL